MKKKKENLTGYLFILPAIILFLFFVLIPVIAMVCLGFTKYNLFSHHNGQDFPILPRYSRMEDFGQLQKTLFF